MSHQPLRQHTSGVVHLEPRGTDTDGGADMRNSSRMRPIHNGRGLMLELEIRSDNDRSRVALIGELDLASAPYLQRVLDELRRDGCQEIVLDLSRLDFLSATGLEAFVHADDQLRAAGGRLILTRPGPRARRVLAITGLDNVLTIRPVPSGGLDATVASEASHAS